MENLNGVKTVFNKWLGIECIVKEKKTEDIGDGFKYHLIDEDGEIIWNGDFLYWSESAICESDDDFLRQTASNYGLGFEEVKKAKKDYPYNFYRGLDILLKTEKDKEEDELAIEDVKEMAKTLGIKKSECFLADVVYNTYTRFINSRELKAIYKGSNKRSNITSKTFFKAYVVGGRVFVACKENGVNLLIEESVREVVKKKVYEFVSLPFAFIIKTEGEGKKTVTKMGICRSYDWGTKEGRK